MAGAVGGLISLPAWTNAWTADTARQYPKFLSLSQDELLAEIVETIIPATDTPGVDSPGAKALNVHQFIQKMVADCYDAKGQETLRKGLEATDELARKSYEKPFAKIDAPQRLALLTQLSQSTEPTQKAFYSLVKNLTIRGYMNSEYVMTNLTHYEMIPGRYHGCVPVVAKATPQGK